MSGQLGECAAKAALRGKRRHVDRYAGLTDTFHKIFEGAAPDAALFRFGFVTAIKPHYEFCDLRRFSLHADHLGLVLPHHHVIIRRMLRISDTVTIEDWELTETFIRASGPGGQNVNKVSTAVELRFEAERSPNLPGAVKGRLRRIAGRKWTKDGALVIQCDETRSQARNRDIARDRLTDMIRQALTPPKRRIATRPTLGSKKRRLKAKKARGTIKALRGPVQPDD